MWELRILDKHTGKTFMKEMYTYEYEQFERKCKHSKKIVILSAFKVY